MDLRHSFTPLPLPPAAPDAKTRSLRRHRALVWLLAVAGAVSVALLLVALLAAGRSTRAFHDVDLSGSLRYRSLWVYGATRPNAALLPEDLQWPAQVAAMQNIRRRLHTTYPQAVDATDPAWNSFENSLARTGQVDWSTANAMRVAADTLTKQIAAGASAQNAASVLGLRLGLAGLLCALAMSGFVLSGLGAAEREMAQALADLQESRNLFLRSINALQEGYLVQDRDGKALLCNRSAERLLGISAADLEGRAAFSADWDCFGENGEFFPEAQQPGLRAIQTGLPQDSVVLGVERPSEARIWFSIQAAPVFHAGEALPYAAVLTFADITAEKQIQADLQKERELQSALLESLQSGVVACDEDGVLALFNRAAREFHGMPEEALPAEEWADHFDLYKPDGITPLPTEEIPLFRAYNGETVCDVEMIIAPKGGLQRIMLASGQAIYDRDGRKLGAVAAMHDITARRQIEQELSRLASIVASSEEAILGFTLDGTIVSWNAGAERLYGYAESEVIGQHALVLVPNGGASPLDTVIPRLLRGESIEPIEVVRHRGGMVLNLALVFSPIRSASGEIIGVSCISRDVTAQRQAEDALRENEARLRYLSDAAFEGIAVSQNGMILDANPAFLSLYGYARDQITGMAGELLTVPESRSMVRQKIADGDEAVYEVECLRGDGGTFHAEVRGRQVLWNGQPARVTAVRDISERKLMEDALRRSEETMRAVLSSAPVILYAADKDGTITLSEGTGLAALGLAPGEAVGRSVDEFSGGNPAAQENTRRAFAGERVSCDMRFGGLCLHVELRPQIGPGGAVSGIIGVCFDITERAQSEERFRVLFEQSSNAHLLFDDDGIIDCNPAAVALMRCADKTGLLGIHPARLSPERQPDGRLSLEKGAEMVALARQNGSHHFEWTRRAADGAEFPVEVMLTEVALGDKPVLLSVWHDLSERKQAEQQVKDYTVILEFQKSQLEETNKELEALATTDGLTGLKNRRSFGAKLSEEYTRAVRYHQPLSLLLLDVDHFKQYNDAFGHPAGDAVLRSVAETLGRTARDTDVAARYGGEEFAIILPLTDEAGALTIAERVRAAIAGSDWKKRPITVSVGAGTLSLDTPTPDSLIACTDGALYQSKEAGRDRVTHGNPSAPPITRPQASRTKRPAAS